MSVASHGTVIWETINVEMYTFGTSEYMYGLYTCENVDNYGWPLTI